MRVAMTVAALSALSCNPASAAQDANTASCGEFPATEASPGFRAFLPDCRAFELVSPPYTGGQPVFWIFDNPPPISPDGDHMLGIAFAGFAGTENEEENGLQFGAVYQFSRTATGWSTEALEPKASQYARRFFQFASADLTRSLWDLVVQSHEGEEVGNPEVYDFAIRELVGGAARFVGVGPTEPPGGREHGLRPSGASRDLTRIVAQTVSETNQVWPGDETREGDESLYQYVGTGNREPTLVGVRNAGPLEGTQHVNEHAELVSRCGTILGAGEKGSLYNAISASGATVYFTALHGLCQTPNVNELYARINGTQTVAISEPSTVDCTLCNTSNRRNAVFQGASDDGSKAFFLSEQLLLSGAKGLNLYEYDRTAEGGKRVVLVAPEAISVARIADGGAIVAYVAKSVVAGNTNPAGAVAESGAYNLYVYDTTTHTSTFVANLLSQSERGASEATKPVLESAKKVQEEKTTTEEKRAEITLRKAECVKEREEGALTLAEECEAKEAVEETEVMSDEATLEGREEEETTTIAGQIQAATRIVAATAVDSHRPFEMTADGRFLVFESARPLTGSEDTSSVGQVFEYDVRGEKLVRVSVGQCPPPMVSCQASERFNNNGSAANPEDEPRILTPEFVSVLLPTTIASVRSLAGNGMVVFSSRGALTPMAVEGRENVYEYRDGNVYLVSPGDEASPLQGTLMPRLLGTDASGQDVFFFTTDSLVPQHTDTQAAWYDARAAGGFPGPPREPASCVDGCQGPLNPGPVLPSGSGSEHAGGVGNLLPPPALTAKRPLTATQIRAQQLAKALKACRTKHDKHKRQACEAQARKRYGPARPKRPAIPPLLARGGK
jgi:hypothetical protein